MTYDGTEVQDPQKNPEIPLEIRDLRSKDKFFIDDKFLNGYAKEVGVFGVGVYVSLCRHADKDQICWPSVNKIAEELNLSRNSVWRGLKNLKSCHIIGTIRIGKQCTNRYILYDRKHWRHRKVKESDVANRDISDVAIRDITRPPQGHHPSLIGTSSSKDTQVRIHKKGYPTASDADWNKFLTEVTNPALKALIRKVLGNPTAIVKQSKPPEPPEPVKE